MRLPSAGAVCGQTGSRDRPSPAIRSPHCSLRRLLNRRMDSHPHPAQGPLRGFQVPARSRSDSDPAGGLCQHLWPPGCPGACLSGARTRQPPRSQAHPGRQRPTEQSAPPGGLRKPPSGWAGEKRGQGTGPAGAGAGDPSMGLYRPLLSLRAESPEKWLQWVSLGHGTRSSF